MQFKYVNQKYSTGIQKDLISINHKILYPHVVPYTHPPPHSSLSITIPYFILYKYKKKMNEMNKKIDRKRFLYFL
jgi:hypothetical protein